MMKKLSAMWLSTVLLTLIAPSLAAAQSVQVEAKTVIVDHHELGATDMGLGGRIGWFLTPAIGIEGEFVLYPKDIPRSRAISTSRSEGLFGVTLGPRLGAVRPFGRVRAGFHKYGDASGPIPCILIFPPPISCTLAGGHTGAALDFGGGVEVAASGGAFVRFDIGARKLRLPGPAFVFNRDRDRHDEDFWGSGVRVALGAGWAF